MNVESILLNYGPLGIMVLVMGWVIVYLAKEGNKKDEKIADLQEKRLTEAVSRLEKYESVVSGFSQTIQLLTAKLTSGGKE